MYEQVKKNGWLRITDFDKYDTAGPTFETPPLSMEKLAELRSKAYQDFYLRPSYVLQMMRKGGTYGRAAVKTSGAYLLRTLHIKTCTTLYFSLPTRLRQEPSTNVPK